MDHYHNVSMVPKSTPEQNKRKRLSKSVGQRKLNNTCIPPPRPEDEEAQKERENREKLADAFLHFCDNKAECSLKILKAVMKALGNKWYKFSDSWRPKKGIFIMLVDAFVYFIAFWMGIGLLALVLTILYIYEVCAKYLPHDYDIQNYRVAAEIRAAPLFVPLPLEERRRLSGQSED